MVVWHTWWRVTRRWVTVMGKRRELDLLITSYASPAAVATPCLVLAAPFTACGIPGLRCLGGEVRWHRRWCPGGDVRLAGCPCSGPPPGNRAAGFPFSGRGTSLGERSERLKAAPGTFHHPSMKAKPHGAADCPAAGEQQAPGGRQVTLQPAARRAWKGRRTCPAGDWPPALPVPLTRGQDFLARPRARCRDNDSAPRGPLMDLLWTCRRPAVDLTPRRRADG